MKKLYFLILLTALPFIGFSQAVINGTFDTDTSSWKVVGDASASISQETNATNVYAGAGSLKLVTIVDGDRAQTDTNADLAGTAGDYLITFKVKGDAGKSIQGSVYNSSLKSGDVLTLTGGWDTYSFVVALDGGNGNVRLVGKDANSTYYFDDVTITPVTITTQDTWVANPNFESDGADWTGSGVDANFSFSTTAPDEGSISGKVTFTQDQTANYLVDNTIHDFGETVNPSEINTSFRVMANSTAINIQVVFKTFDASDAVLETATTGSENVAVAGVWQDMSFNKLITTPFNKIQYRLKIKSPSAVNTDSIEFDMITAEFTYLTLGVDDVDYRDDVNITLYPNPVQNILSINAPTEVEKIEVYNVLGQKVLEKLDSKTIQVGSLSKGAYISKIFMKDDRISTKRFFKE